MKITDLMKHTRIDEISRRGFLKGAGVAAAGAAGLGGAKDAKAGKNLPGELIKKIKRGMTEYQVKQIMGEPDGFDEDERGRTILLWRGLVSGWSWDQGSFAVIFDPYVVAAKRVK